MACPNTTVMVKTGEGDQTRPKCTNTEFDPDSGLGIPERVGGELTFICDPCGFPKARQEVTNRLADLAWFRENFTTVEFGDVAKRIETAAQKLDLYEKVQGDPKFASARSRVVDAVAQAFQTCKRAFYDLRDVAITQLTEQASAKLAEVGEIKVEDPQLQERLDSHRHDALRLIDKARADLENSRQRGIRRQQRSKLMKNGCGNARIAMHKVLAYARRQEAEVDEAAIRAEMEAASPATEAEEPGGEHTRDSLLALTKKALIALALEEFNLEIKDSMTKDDMADAVLEAQEKAKTQVAA